MAKRSQSPVFAPSGMGQDAFPETQVTLLEQAAAGNWEPFLRDYVSPCCRELEIVCRIRGVPLPDAEDLFQELMIRAIKTGEFGNRVRQTLRESGQETDFQGNLVQKYLRYRELPLPAVKFRTFLKQVILNLVREAVRGQSARPSQSLDEKMRMFEPCVEESISRCLDAPWLADCLTSTAVRLQAESRAAHTRGNRRLFDVLSLSVAKELSNDEIARLYELKRTTVAGLLTRARARFVTILRETTGVDDVSELKEMVSRIPGALKEALIAARSGGHPARRADREGPSPT